MAPSDTLTGLERRAAWFAASSHQVDAVVIGLGVVGAAIFRRLAAAGWRVVAVDRSDVGSGASQGSANLVWGGLLYLARGRLDEVWRWTRERDRLVADASAGVAPLPCAYRIDRARRHPRLVQAGLIGYWLLGGGRGAWPRERDGHLLFHEALLGTHDARWAWERIAAAPATAWAATWCAIESICRSGEGWELDLADRLGPGTTRLRTPLVINAAGAWAGRVDAQAGIDHDWDLVPSRGVSLVVAGRPAQALMVEHPAERDVLSLVPYPQAEAAVWGSTETLVATPDAALRPDIAEVATLIRLHRRLIGPLERDRLLGVRCGVRALAVRRGATARRSQDLTAASASSADRTAGPPSSAASSPEPKRWRRRWPAASAAPRRRRRSSVRCRRATCSASTCPIRRGAATTSSAGLWPAGCADAHRSLRSSRAAASACMTSIVPCSPISPGRSWARLVRRRWRPTLPRWTPTRPASPLRSTWRQRSCDERPARDPRRHADRGAGPRRR